MTRLRLSAATVVAALLIGGCATNYSDAGVGIPASRDRYWPERTHVGFAVTPPEIPVRRLGRCVLEVRSTNGRVRRIGNSVVHYDLVGILAPDIRLITLDGIDWEGEPTVTALVHLASGSIVEHRFAYSESTPHRDLMLIWSRMGNLVLVRVDDSGLRPVLSHRFREEINRVDWTSADCLDVVLTNEQAESVRLQDSQWTHEVRPCPA